MQPITGEVGLDRVLQRLIMVSAFIQIDAQPVTAKYEHRHQPDESQQTRRRVWGGLRRPSIGDLQAICLENLVNIGFQAMLQIKLRNTLSARAGLGRMCRSILV